MIYITDKQNGRISVFNLSGHFVATFGNNLFHPEAIAIDDDGYVYVTKKKIHCSILYYNYDFVSTGGLFLLP